MARRSMERCTDQTHEASWEVKLTRIHHLKQRTTAKSTNSRCLQAGASKREHRVFLCALKALRKKDKTELSLNSAQR